MDTATIVFRTSGICSHDYLRAVSNGRPDASRRVTSPAPPLCQTFSPPQIADSTAFASVRRTPTCYWIARFVFVSAFGFGFAMVPALTAGTAGACQPVSNAVHRSITYCAAAVPRSE